MPIVADAAVKVGADMAPFNRDLKAGGEKGTRTLGQQLKGAFSPQNLAVAGVAGGLAIAGAITAGLVGAAKSLIDIERLNAQTDAAIRSTGGVANVSRGHIEDMAESMESLTTIEREVVQEADNMLLTFTNVRNEVGAGNDIFDQATEAALNMSVALGTDATSAAMLLGKALNDPVKGMTAMTRAGIQFTDQQKAMIKAMVEAGDLLGAQKIILGELETQFGGSAEAFASTTAGKIQRFQNEIGNFFESIIVGVVDVGDAFGDVRQEWADSLGAGVDVLDDTLAAVGDFVFGHKEAVSSMPSDAQVAALAAVRAVETEYVKGGPVIAEEAGKIAGMLPAEIHKRDAEIRAAAFGGMVAYAQGVLDGQNGPLVAQELMHRAMKEGMTRETETANLMGRLHSEELARGINSRVPAVRAAAASERAAIVERLEFLTSESYQWGYNIGSGLAAGIESQYGTVKNAAGDLAAAVRGQIGIRSEPSDPSSPLHGITKWGGNIVKTIADGIYGELGTGRAAAATLAGSLRPGIGIGGSIPLTAAASSNTMGSGGNTINVSMIDRIEKRTVEDVGAGLKRLDTLGRLPR